jgi:peptidoglycan-associated lipoprotein
MNRTYLLLVTLLSVAFIAGCPKQIPQPEIDSAQAAMADIESYKDCAPETYQAAKTMMDRAQALLKEERYEEAKTSLLAAKRLAEKAKEECKKKKEEEAKAAAEKKKQETEPVAREMNLEEDDGPQSLVTVHFGFNEAALTDEAREALNNNAKYLSKRESLRVMLKGHCDNRGSTEYNLLLGERRAVAVRNYLIKLGVNPGRLEIMSLGEEQPLDPAETEDAWAKNRRAEFEELK